MPNAEKKYEDSNEDSYYETMTLCSVCEKEMPTLNYDISTCQRCQQWIKESLELTAKNDSDKEDNFDKGNTRTQRDDETEFKRISMQEKMRATMKKAGMKKAMLSRKKKKTPTYHVFPPRQMKTTRTPKATQKSRLLQSNTAIQEETKSKR
jgi:hypothetical protein